VSSVEEAGPDPTRRSGTWWSATVQWRNWPLLVKLGVVLVVPVVSALVLGVLRVQADVELAGTYAAIERVATLREQVVTVVSAIQEERDQALRAGGELEDTAAATDRAVATLGDVVRKNPELADASSGYAAVDRALDSLPAARRQVTGGAGGMIVLSAYNGVIDPALEFDRTLVGRFPDETLTGASLGLSELQGMREEIAIEGAIGNLAMRDRVLPSAALELLVEADVRFDDKLDDFLSQAPAALTASYEEAVTGQNVAIQQQMVDAFRTTDPTSLPFTQSEWDAASAATNFMMTDLTRQAASSLRSDSAALAESISNRAGLESVLLLTMVLLAAGVGGGLGRYLVRSVGLLRRTALDVANTGLPAAVESIRAGKGASIKVDPVPLRTTEELGQLARAFDAVHDQAVRSAAEEAGLRSNLANIFTNLSRRSQGLVERQLRLMEQLEQKTEDPEQLENLFKIDHLATRMRRNNENLMVLSGTGLLRRFNEPMPLPDVLRAAISEVEHYQRAEVRSVPDVRIAGYAAGDLIRSISELIENATAFSPPDAQVAVVSRLLPDGSAVIDIVDTGVGMGERELRDANQKITGGGGVDVPISRQMGLFVVGRLTARHGIHVRLIQRAEGGLCASVLVPAGLVNIADPGQTVSIELPMGFQGAAPVWPNQTATTGWPVQSDGAASPAPAWPDDRPAAATSSSWLVGAAGTGPATTGERSMAASWLESTRKAESAPEQADAAEQAGTAGRREPAKATGPVESAGPVETNAAGLPVRGRRSGSAERSDGRLAPANGTAPVETNAAGLPVRVPGAAERSASRLDPATPVETNAAGLPVRVPGAAERSAGRLDPVEKNAAGLPIRVPGAADRPGPAETTAWLETGATAPAETGGASGRSMATSWLEAAREVDAGLAGESAVPSTGANGSSEPTDPAVTQIGGPGEFSPGSPEPSSEETAEAGETGQVAAGHHLPGEIFEPVEVAGRLESAGIIVTLPDLPVASTPASILFADSTMGGDDGQATTRFSWLRNPPKAGAPAPAAGFAPVAPVTSEVGPAGLPKRVPKSQLLASTREQPPLPRAGTRDADRARGFLSGFQAGIRQGENREGETGS
jgi:signal transduction histidine kinase